MTTSRMNFGTGLPGDGAQTPYQRIIEPHMLGVFVNLEQRDVNRLKKYQEAWNFFLGQHWRFQREGGDPLVTMNLCKLIIEKGVTWLVSQGFKLKNVPEMLYDYVTQQVEDVWKYNDKDILLQEIAQIGGVCGDVYIMITLEDVDPKSMYFADLGPQAIRLQVLDPSCVFPIWDPLNTKNIIGVKIVRLFVDESPYTQNPPHQSGQANLSRFTQVILRDRIIEQREGQDPVTKNNPLGEIPVVHIRNMVVGTEFYGFGDLDGGVIDLQRELNEKATDVSDIINYQSSPVTVIVGARVSNLERGAKKIWSGFPEGTQVFNLGLQSDLSASTSYMDRIERCMYDITEQSASSISSANGGISNTSGVALHTTFQPIIERTKRKKPLYEKGLTEINYFIVRWLREMKKYYPPMNFCRHCGGKLLDVAVTRPDGSPRLRVDGTPITKRMCFHADPHTDDFLDAEEVKVKHIRSMSFGDEITEAPWWRVVAEMLNLRTSFWDPVGTIKAGGELKTPEEHAQEADRDRENIVAGNFPDVEVPAPERESAPPPPPRIGPNGEEIPVQPPPPKKPTQTELRETLLRAYMEKKLPEGAISLPEEPQTIRIMTPTGTDAEGRTVYAEMDRVLVPTGCSHCVPFNPYRLEVELNNALPRDEHLDAQLSNALIGIGVWSRAEGMRRMRVENIGKMFEECEAEGFYTKSGQRGDDTPSTDLQGNEDIRDAQRGGSNNKAPFQPSKPSPGAPKKPV